MSEITLSQYIFERLYQIDVRTVFGVPGDFNLSMLDKIYTVEDKHGKGSFVWAGNANELNAAYAADGYSRVKKMAALITTYGVGELSALNGVAGAYAEHVGLVHIVGTPSTTSVNKGLLLHHTLGEGNFNVYYDMSKHLSVAHTFLNDLNTAPAEIDRMLRTAYVRQKPTYLGVPANFVDMKVPASLLDTPIDLSLPKNDVEGQAEVVDTVLEMVRAAKNPIIIVDACASRHDCKPEVKKLVETTQFPVYTTPLGKGAVDEGGVDGHAAVDDPEIFKKVAARLLSDKTAASRFGGVYVGSLSKPEVKAAVEASDLILSVGALLSDFNTGAFSYLYSTHNVVEFHSDHTKIRRAIFENVGMKEVLNVIIPKIGEAAKNIDVALLTVPKIKLANTPAIGHTKITQEWWWTRVSSWFRPGDVIVTETGTSAFGIVQSRFPNDTTGISQVLYGSIGYSVGATFGAVMGAREIDPKKRVILFVGDGSLQLTVQAISDMIRNGCNPYLFILNNDGYTIERLIHGPNAQYNDIQSWDHQTILSGYKATNDETLLIKTVGETNDLFSNKEFNEPSKIRVIEVMLDKMDAPENLKVQAAISAKTNASN